MRFAFRRIIFAALCLMLLCQSALAYETLEKGDSGNDVLQMQIALTQLGYTVSCDGNYGAETYNAVKLFQSDNKLEKDGKAGNQTLSLLYSLYTSSIISSNNPQSGTQTTTPPAETVRPTATVYCADGGKLNLRKTASTGAKVLKQIPTGTQLVIYEQGSKWCYTTYNGEWGYVMTSFLRFDTTQTPSAPTTPDSSTTAQTATVYCADGGKLNLRKSASSNAAVLRQIPNGTALSILERGTRWCKTSYSGETGYVMTSFLIFNTTTPTYAPVATPTWAPVITPVPESTVWATVYCEDGGKLNLRKTMSTGAKVLKQIPTGTQLVIQEKGTTWCKTSYAGETGYVMTKFLRFNASATQAPAVTPVPTVKPTTAPTTAPGTSATRAIVNCANGGKLNLRSGRGTGYRVVYQIPNLSEVIVLQQYGSWTQVAYGAYSGYVMTSYLHFTTGTTSPTVKPTVKPNIPTPTPIPYTGDMRYGEYRYATVQTASGGTLNLRKGPDTSYSTSAYIPNGTRIVVRAMIGDWCDVYWQDKQGYVKTEFLYIDAGRGDYEDSSLQYDVSILTRTLRGGETGADVQLVQTRLQELNYLSSVSGIYDSNTVNAVKSFQKLHNLTVDGKSGTSTYNVLFSSQAFPYTPVTETYSTYNIRYNESSGSGTAEKQEAVRRAQEALRALNYLCPINGDFDEATHDAIVDFQLRNGLTASGILDAATQVRLYSDSARDAASPSRFYLPANAGTEVIAPEDVSLMHWADEVKAMISNGDALTVYDPATGLSFKLRNLSRGRHWDVEPHSLTDTFIMRKAFNGMSWTIRVVYVMLPDGSWSMATMHNRAHGTNTIKDNGFGGQNCVHFLRDMSETQANDPNYGVKNQEALREAWYKLTGETIPYK